MQRKPWPMWWMVVAMVVFIVPYTVLTLRYRKAASFQPYEDARERKHLAQAGYTRLSLSVGHWSGALPGNAGASEPGGLPGDLDAALIDRPALPAAPLVAAAPAASDPRHDYVVRFFCAPAAGGGDWAPATAHLYRKGAAVWLVIGMARAAHASPDGYQIAIAGAAIDPGTYVFHLVGAERSQRWTVQVN